MNSSPVSIGSRLTSEESPDAQPLYSLVAVTCVRSERFSPLAPATDGKPLELSVNPASVPVAPVAVVNPASVPVVCAGRANIATSWKGPSYGSLVYSGGEVPPDRPEPEAEADPEPVGREDSGGQVAPGITISLGAESGKLMGRFTSIVSISILPEYAVALRLELATVDAEAA